MLQENQLAEVIRILVKSMSPSLIYLFGSQAKNMSRPESDVDIAFLSFENQLDAYAVFECAQEIAASIGKEVDLIDLRKASTVFQANIIYSGIAIYCTDEKERQLFEATVFQQYAKLNEERAVVIEKIEMSGTVYEK